MTPLRKKMFAVLRAKNLPLDIQEKYVAEVAAMAASYGKSPDQLNPEQVRDYLERCARQMIAEKLVAFGYFYEGTLGWGWDAEAMMPRPPRNNQKPWLPDNPLRQQMIQDMGLRNLTPRTQKEYLRWIGTFADFHRETPDVLGLEEVREYLVHLLNEKKRPSTFAVARAALKFLYKNTLQRSWALVDFIPVPKREKRLPVILDQSEVAHLIDSTKNVRHRAIMMTLYAAGLRVSEVTNLRVSDIDSKRMMIRVEQGKGQKDRYVMLSPRLLEELRSYWKAMRPNPWLFGGNSPISTRAIEKAVTRTAKAAGISKPVSPKTLRHCFATHMLEGGARIEQIQLLLGHRSLRTTMVYIRISTSTVCAGQSPLDLLPI